MATLALGAVGTAIVGSGASATAISIAGAIGGAIGSFIDNAFLVPTLIGPRHVETGHRIDTLQVQGASEGAVLKRLVGPCVRVPGTVIWKGPHDFRTTTTQTGGKGVGGGVVTQSREYFVNLAVAIGEEIDSTGGAGLKKAWYNGDLFYDISGDFNVGPATDISANLRVRIIGTNPNVFTYTLELHSTVTDLSGIVAGSEVVVSGFTGPLAVNNGTYTALVSDATQVDLEATINQASGAAGDPVTLAVDIPDIDPEFAFDIREHPGGPFEASDALIVAVEGNTTAYRNTYYAVVQGLELTKTGSNIVGQFHWMVEAHPGPFTVGDAILALLDFYDGTVPFTVDVSACTEDFTGMAVQVIQPIRQSIKELMLIYDLAVQEDGPVLRFFPRSAAEQFTVPEEDFIWTEDPNGNDSPRPVRFSDVDVRERYTEVNVTFPAAESDQVVKTVTAVDNSLLNITERNVADIETPVVLTSAQALKVGYRVLYSSQAAGRAARFTLGPKWSNLLPSDVVLTTLNGRDYCFYLTRVVAGYNGIIECEAVEQDPELLTLTDAEVEPEQSQDPSILAPPAPLSLEMIDLASLTKNETQTPGVYWAAAIIDPFAQFIGAQLWVSSDDIVFNFVASFPGETVRGEAETVLASSGVQGTVLDRENSVTVELFHGSLTSITEEEMIFGSNAAILGDEVIGFSSVTQLTQTTPGRNRYTLNAPLLRARLNSDNIGGSINGVTSHQIGERFVLLNQAGIVFESLPITTKGTVRYYKVVPNGVAVADVSSFPFTVELHNIEPWAPVSPRYITTTDPVLGAGVRIFWNRRHRVPPPYSHTPNNVPLQEPSEQYEVEFSNTAGGVPLLTVLTANTVFLTDSQRTTVGLNSTFFIKVSQISQFIGASPRSLITSISV